MSLCLRINSWIFSRNALSPASLDSNFFSKAASRGSRRRMSSNTERGKHAVKFTRICQSWVEWNVFSVVMK